MTNLEKLKYDLNEYGFEIVSLKNCNYDLVVEDTSRNDNYEFMFQSHGVQVFFNITTCRLDRLQGLLNAVNVYAESEGY